MEKMSVDTGAPEYAIAAAKKVAQAPAYWPGRDYPDREVWLKKRATQREVPPVTTVYRANSYEPLALGINQAKRVAALQASRLGDSTNPKQHRGGCRQSIIVSRHNYYHDRYEAQQS